MLPIIKGADVKVADTININLAKNTNVPSVPQSGEKTFSQMKDVFSFVGNDCYITAPTMAVEKTTDKSRTHDVVLHQDLLLISNIVEMISAHKKRISFRTDNLTTPRTEIHFGGPVVNFCVNRYFNSIFKQIDFEWHVKKDSYEKICSRYTHLEHNNYVRCNEEWEGMSFSGKRYKFQENKKDCAFLIKSSGNKQGTTHIFGGCGTMGRIGAANYFVNNYINIYEKYKSKPYFIVAEVDIDKDGSPHLSHFEDFSKRLKKP